MDAGLYSLSNRLGKGLHSCLGSPCATLFITVLFLPQLTENLQYQRVIKDHAASDEVEAALNHISGLLCLDASCHSLTQLLSHYVTARCHNNAQQFKQVKSRQPFILPNSIPNSFDITQLPLGGFLPPGVLAASEAFNLFFRPQIFQHPADHIHADVRAPVLNFGHAEGTESTVYSMKNETRFLSLGTPELAETLLEFTIGHLDDGKNVIDIWPGVMFALVPALGALLQGFVIPLLVLFDEALQADITADLEPQVVALQEQK
jgi:hypothetical protein